MIVPLIVVVPSQDSVRESALAFAERRLPTQDLADTSMPSSLVIDDSVPAIPLGTGRIEDVATTTFDPADSETFAVRAFADVDTLEDLPEEVQGRRVFADPLIASFVTCSGSPPFGTVADIEARLSTRELQARGLDGTNVAVAIMDTGINLQFLNTRRPGVRLDAANSWTPAGSLALPGRYPVDHGTMCAFDALIAAPNATLLDYPILGTVAPGATVTGRTLSSAMLAFSQLLTGWAVSFSPTGLSKYRGLVVNNSWGIYHHSWDFPPGHRGRYIDNPQHPFNLLVSNMALSGIDLIFAAGNCGPVCADLRCRGTTTQTIMGANAHADVLTLAGCDIDDEIVGYSSQGPSIAQMFQQKPDVAAYTHFDGSRAFGADSPDVGTSAASPVAAGCIAAIRTRLRPASTSPVDLFSQIRMTARPRPGKSVGSRMWDTG